MTDDRRAKGGDYLLAHDNGECVGTSTSLSLNLWSRGKRVPCQGVAWVGTVKSRRRGGAGKGEGVASKLMHETLRLGRERGEVVSALMPFRASFYEHFGYGVVERRADWTVPLSILPTGDCGLSYFDARDAGAVTACRQRQVERGQCDIETPGAQWQTRHEAAAGGMQLVERVGESVKSWMHVADAEPSPADSRRTLRVVEHAADDFPAFLRQLNFLAGLRDQYSFATITLPADIALNRVLREVQIPHRPVDHPTARVSHCTRMQMRVLDHVGFLNGQNLRPGETGSVTVAVKESEGNAARFNLGFAHTSIEARPSTATPDAECSDKTWASIASGDLRATTAAAVRLLDIKDEQPLTLLDRLADCPPPFCNEYF